jgi:hypothetical protein
VTQLSAGLTAKVVEPHRQKYPELAELIDQDFPADELLYHAFQAVDVTPAPDGHEVVLEECFLPAQGRIAWPPRGLSCDRERYFKGCEVLVARLGYRFQRVGAVACGALTLDEEKATTTGYQLVPVHLPAAEEAPEEVTADRVNRAHTEIHADPCSDEGQYATTRPRDDKDATAVLELRQHLARAFRIEPGLFLPPA